MMGTLRKILAIAAVDTRIEFESPASWLFFLVVPLIFTAMLGLSFGGGGPIGVLVVDEDHSPVSAQLITALRADRGIDPSLVSAADATTASGGTNPPPVLTIPAGFGSELVAGTQPGLRLDYASETTAVLAARQAVVAATVKLGGAVAAAQASTAQVEAVHPFADAAARSAYAATALTRAEGLVADPPATTVITTSPNVTLIPTGYGQSSPGQLVMWTLITLLGASEVFISERTNGTLRRILVTPTGHSTILIGKIAGRYALGLVQMALLVGVGALAFNVPWGRSPLALLLVVLSFALMAVALGVLLATISRTRAQASQLTILFAMLLSALGGAWFPLEVTPSGFQAVARLLPTTWAMHGLNEVILRGGGPAAVLPSVGILLAFAAAFFLISKRRLRLD